MRSRWGTQPCVCICECVCVVRACSSRHFNRLKAQTKSHTHAQSTGCIQKACAHREPQRCVPTFSHMPSKPGAATTTAAASVASAVTTMMMSTGHYQRVRTTHAPPQRTPANVWPANQLCKHSAGPAHRQRPRAGAAYVQPIQCAMSDCTPAR